VAVVAPRDGLDLADLTRLGPGQLDVGGDRLGRAQPERGEDEECASCGGKAPRDAREGLVSTPATLDLRSLRLFPHRLLQGRQGARPKLPVQLLTGHALPRFATQLSDHLACCASFVPDPAPIGLYASSRDWRFRWLRVSRHEETPFRASGTRIPRAGDPKSPSARLRDPDSGARAHPERGSRSCGEQRPEGQPSTYQ